MHAMPGPEPIFTAPASFAQQRLWFLDRLLPGSGLYNLPMAWRVTGPLDAQALKAAFHALVGRHEVLRSTLAGDDTGVVQQVLAHAVQPDALHGMPRLVLEDRSDEPVTDATLLNIVSDEAQRPFDLTSGPLIRMRLIKRSGDDHLLMMTLHHAIADGGSLPILVGELLALYEAQLDGTEADLPSLSLHYADYAAWQRDQLRGDRLDRLLHYWRQALADAPQHLDLPTDRARPPLPSHRGDWVAIEFGSRQSAALRRIGQRLGATTFMVCAALLQVLLFRCTGQRDLLMGYPVTGRDREELEPMVGLFVNTLVMRAQLSPDQTFSTVLEQVRRRTLDAHEHRELPFELLVQALEADRDARWHPLFQVALSHAHEVDGIPERAGLTLHPLASPRRTSKFDLTLSLSEGRDGRLGGGLEYSTDLFDASTMQAWARRLICLVDAVLETPDRPIARLDILPAAERDQLPSRWNPPAAQRPAWCVHQRVEQHARCRPDAGAVESPELRLSYGELNARADAVVGQLLSQETVAGASAGLRVGLWVHRSAWMVVGMLGALKAGAAYVPLDPALPQERLAYIMADLGVDTVLTTRAWAARWAAMHGPEAPRLVVMDELPPGAPPCRTRSPAAADLAYALHTSGSTGRPKAVAVSHGALSALVSWHHQRYGSSPADRMTQVASLGFDACTWEVWACLVAGSTLVIVEDDLRGDPARLLDFMARQQVTHAFLPTPLAEAFMAAPQALHEGLALRVLLTGGDRLHQSPPPGLPYALVNHYGPTEAAVVATAETVAPGTAGVPSIGRPIETAQVYVLDADGELVPPGAPGELAVGGAGVADGYWGAPALTAQRFVPDPFGTVPGARLFLTGDLARHRSDGRIEFLGRLDRQTKLRGQRIEPGEIEAVLARHPGVRRCSVHRVTTPAGLPVLTALVECEETDPAGEPQWREHLARSLPAVMVPEIFVRVQALPMLPSGKLDLVAAADLAQARSVLVPSLVPQAPRTPLERQLTDLWRELLGVDTVGIHDNFFKLGGQSLLVIQFVARAHSGLGIALRVRDVFEHPTIARLHDYICGLQWLALPDQEGQGARAPTHHRDGDLETGEL